MLEAGERKLERADVHGFLSAIHDRYGYDLRGYAPASIQRRVETALRRSGVSSLAELARRAVAEPAFFADVLGLASVDAGEGWLIFALPPSELAAHPASADGGGYDLYLMCDDIEATVRELTARGVEFGDGITEQRWGLITTIRLTGGGRLGLYEPRHASPLHPAG